MAEDQRNARTFGVLFLITFATSIGAVLLFQPVLDDPAGYIAGDGKGQSDLPGCVPPAADHLQRRNSRPSTRSCGDRTSPSHERRLQKEETG